MLHSSHQEQEFKKTTVISKLASPPRQTVLVRSTLRARSSALGKWCVRQKAQILPVTGWSERRCWTAFRVVHRIFRMTVPSYLKCLIPQTITSCPLLIVHEYNVNKVFCITCTLLFLPSTEIDHIKSQSGGWRSVELVRHRQGQSQWNQVDRTQWYLGTRH